MFKSSIKGNKIKEVMTALTAMVDEARLNITPGGISVKAVDPANVAMVSMTLEKEAFESFEATDGVLGIDLTKLSGFVEMADNNDVIELELIEDTHKLKITFRGLSYTLSLLDPEAMRKEPKIPSLDLPVEISISGTDFKYGLKAADKIAEYVSFGVDAEVSKFYLSASGDMDEVIYEVPADRLKIVKASEAKSLFAMEYLIEIQKLAEKTGEITIIMGKDYPIKIGFPISEGKGTVEYMIAPRVETDN